MRINPSSLYKPQRFSISFSCMALYAFSFSHRRYSDSDVEIKRVWVDPEFRGNHISTAMMDALEKKAIELGFKRAILQTRPQMKEAVHLYTKRGYLLTDNYPPYDKLEGAICFAKEL